MSLLIGKQDSLHGRSVASLSCLCTSLQIACGSSLLFAAVLSNVYISRSISVSDADISLLFPLSVLDISCVALSLLVVPLVPSLLSAQRTVCVAGRDRVHETSQQIAKRGEEYYDEHETKKEQKTKKKWKKKMKWVPGEGKDNERRHDEWEGKVVLVREGCVICAFLPSLTYPKYPLLFCCELVQLFLYQNDCLSLSILWNPSLLGALVL